MKCMNVGGRKKMFYRWSFLVLVLWTTLNQHAAPDPFGEGVRNTEPRTPEEQLKTFHVPPGFEVQLVAAEPDLRKPMNMAFDAKGRLWYTESREYPFAAPLDKPSRDTIRVLSDFDAGGRARKVEIFADGLNIPTGLYPYKNGVVAWSIPNIWFFEDTDGDGKSDKRTKLFGPLGWERDTHGMNSSFRRGFDGWLYITHGFNNNSTVRATDGSEITMNSGNTYRVKLDGSRVEQHTFGQVNPFGFCFDELGNAYSADCHSAPIYQLLRGGYYPSFGKPHDGLGYAPFLMEHSHGSTAIAGVLYYSDDHWPAEYRDNMFVGNVMSSRLNRDRMVALGTTKLAIESPDFLTCDDPWFRPVDIQYGPDGALYIADFYNRIIGHYEVPLTHPGRDRDRGRIWRVVYKGDGSKPATRGFDVSKAGLPGLIAEMGSGNLTRRTLALHELVDRMGSFAVPELKKTYAQSTNSYLKVQALWALHRLSDLPEDLLLDAGRSPDQLLRVHSLRIFSEIPSWSQRSTTWIRSALEHSDPLTQRTAAEALGLHPSGENIKPLVQLTQKVNQDDTHLRYAVRMALRNQLRDATNLQEITGQVWNENESRTLADVAVAVPKPEAASLLLHHIQTYPENQETLARYLAQTARHLPKGELETLIGFVRKKIGNNLDLQLVLFKGIQEALGQRGEGLGTAASNWGAELARASLNHSTSSQTTWHNMQVAGLEESKDPWFVQPRSSADGNNSLPFLCSLPPGGERLTGILRSPEFKVPARLEFFAAGHDGIPTKPASGKNLIRLRDVKTGEILAQAAPPRNDLAQKITWDIAIHTNKTAVLEVVDGDTGEAYAWLAIGRLNPEVVAFPTTSPSGIASRQIAGAELAGQLNLRDLKPALVKLLADPGTLECRRAVARTLATFSGDETLQALAAIVGDPTLSLALEEKIENQLSLLDKGSLSGVIDEIFRTAPDRLQLQFARIWTGSMSGARAFLNAVSEGKAPARLLLDRVVTDKITATKTGDLAAQHASLTKNVSPVNGELQRLIEDRRAKFKSHPGPLAGGAQLFTLHCAVCHRIGGAGNIVGPQLDGIGNRGLERLSEDLLDPNRNVDRAFRTHILVLKDGDVVTGLPRREEGEILILADSTGKEISIPKKNIESRRESETSLMPDNLGDLLNPSDFNQLMTYLLNQSGRSE